MYSPCKGLGSARVRCRVQMSPGTFVVVTTRAIGIQEELAAFYFGALSLLETLRLHLG